MKTCNAPFRDIVGFYAGLTGVDPLTITETDQTAKIQKKVKVIKILRGALTQSTIVGD